MIIQDKTIEKLRNLINEETEYRSGPILVQFFNDLGFNDSYGQGFPSRWFYTEGKLKKINGTPELDKCMKKLFSPVNFIGRFSELDIFIKDLNQYLIFDKWKVIRNNTEISFKRVDKINTNDSNKDELKEEDFLNMEFDSISLKQLELEESITATLEYRFEEIKKCLKIDAPLAVILLCGSSLEGVLLGVATKHPIIFNKAVAAPKNKEGKVRSFQNWSLYNLINVAYELDLLKEDVKKYSHSLRDFRNYIHPYEQTNSRFNPDKHTARISWQVLKAAIYQLSSRENNLH